jgi:chemotaxis protein methyltransferase CheR
MTDAECVQLLQWALPALRLRWPGFRKVRKQVCRRIDRRRQELALADVAQYRAHLETHAEEWDILDTLCRIPISRFYRDRGVFEFLEHEVLPELARLETAGGGSELRCWSLGCAGGEEPYSLAILWQLRLAPRFPSLACWILATDADERAIARAEQGCYAAGSLTDLPPAWRLKAFVPEGEKFCLKPAYRDAVAFVVQDFRRKAPAGPFHLILCRNLVFTYFAEPLQRESLHTIAERLAPGGALVIGKLESLPEEGREREHGLEPWSRKMGVYRKAAPDPAKAI